MLVLARKLHEKIMIGDDIVIEIVSNYNGTVRVGIDAPRELPVHREEIYRDINRNRARKRIEKPKQDHPRLGKLNDGKGKNQASEGQIRPTDPAPGNDSRDES